MLGSRFYENENKHEIAIHENKHARGRPKGKGYTIATKAYADDLIGSEVKCLINQPTRVCKNSKSLLDYIYSNNLNN